MPAIDSIDRIQNLDTSSSGWLSGATIYGVVVRNFGNGDFQSVIDRLDDLSDLGVAALWFAPITQTPPGCFGYEVTNYLDVRPEYGTLADFRRLVDEAHARNLRVLLDFVPNHTSSKHPYYQSVLELSGSSPWYDFYDRDEQGEVTHYFDWTHLPNLNFDNPDVRQFITDAFMFWVNEMDVDGFRVDVAWGIKQRYPDFWPAFSVEFKRAKPDGVLIAEASARDPYYLSHGFDAAYDWTDQLGEWSWNGVFSDGDSIPDAIVRALTVSGSVPDAACLRFLNNNDTGSRFISKYGVDMYRVASAMLLTLPGVPCLFTGDDVGAEFEPYRDSGAIDWTDRHDLRSHFRALVRLRNELPAFASGRWSRIETEPESPILSYTIGDESEVLVLLNFSGQPVSVNLDPTLFPAETRLRDHYTKSIEALPSGSSREIALAGWSIRILAVERVVR
jgi:glycosidase